MAVNKNKAKREFKFVLTDDDYSAFGRYRILYTKGGRKLVNRQRLTYIISGLTLAALFTIFPVSRHFAMLAYVVAAIIGIGGPLYSERMLLKQQEKAIRDSGVTAEGVHQEENIVTLGDDKLITDTGSDHQEFDYKDIKQVDLTEDAIYVWMSETMIMPIPQHAFRNMDDMKEAYKLIREKVQENGGTLADD